MRKVLLLILIGGIWYLAAMYRSVLLLSLSMAGLLLLVILFLLPKIQKWFFTARFTQPSQFIKQKVPDLLTLEVRKGGLFPVARGRYRLAFQYDGDKKPVKRWYKGGFSEGTSTIDLPIEPSYSGMLHVTLEKVKIQDPFGVFSASKKVSSKIRVVVFPLDREAESPSALYTGVSEEQKGSMSGQKPGSEGDIRQIRSWMPGDNRHQIHWKLTARLQETMIQEWSEERGQTQSLVLERENKDYTAEEASQFYETLYDRITQSFKSNAGVHVIWMEEGGLPITQEITDREGLEDLLIRLYDSRWLWGGRHE